MLALANDHSRWPWLDPVFGANLYDAHLSTGALWTLGIVDAVVALVGVFIGLAPVVAASEHPELEARSCRNSWYLDDIYDAVIGRPPGGLAAFCAT